MPSIYKLRATMWTSIVLTIIVFSIFAFGLGLIVNYFLPVLSYLDLLIVALIFSLGFVFLEYLIGPLVVRASLRGRFRPLNPGENRWLEETVEKLAQHSGLKAPKLAVVQDPTPNAFTFGRTRNDATLAVHTGLLENLKEDEIAGVLGHELGHVAHKDYLVLTMLAAIPTLAYLVARISFESIWLTRGSRSKSGGSIVAVAIAVGVLSLLVYAIAQLLILGLSRLREHYADAYSAYLTKSPRSLISALAKITYGLSVAPKRDATIGTFYIISPAMARQEIDDIMSKREKYDLDKDGMLDEAELEKAMEEESKSLHIRFAELYSTHPPTFKRILLLQEMDRELSAQIPEQ